MELASQSVGGFDIIEEVGRGGMAVVYRAYQPSLHRFVAIKVLAPYLALDRQFVDRFLREARAAARLHHPHIVAVYDVGEERGLYYIVMELLKGCTLNELVEREGPLPAERTASILEQVADALDYAHEEGFVHRDVKAANIHVGRNDRVTLTDFGIAKAISESSQLTRTGMLVGTPEYMSPEQAEGLPVDHRMDLYALGVVLYQMLAGRVPFKGSTPLATLHAVVYDAPPPPRQFNPDLAPAVESVVLRALAKKPDRRFQRGLDLSAALRAAVGEGQQPVAHPAASAEPAAREPEQAPVAAGRRFPLLPGMAGLAAVSVLVLLGLVLVPRLITHSPAPVSEARAASATPTVAASAAEGQLVEQTVTLAPTVEGTPGEPQTATDVVVPTEAPTVRPTQTLVPTSPPAMATLTPSPTKTRASAPRPTRTHTPRPQYPAPTLVAPREQDAESLRGEVTFQWTYAQTLYSWEAFQVLIWKAGGSHNGAAQYWRALEQTINLDEVPQMLQPGDYLWSVVVVDTATGERVSAEAAPWRLNYIGQR